MLHIMSNGHGDNPPVDRPLQPYEHGMMQGFPTYICRAMVDDPVTAVQAFGNAMAIPVIGSVIANELASIIRQIGGAGLTKFLSRFGVSRWPLAAGDPGTPPPGPGSALIQGSVSQLFSTMLDQRGVANPGQHAEFLDQPLGAAADGRCGAGSRASGSTEASLFLGGKGGVSVKDS